jgi:hypothetical protein
MLFIKHFESGEYLCYWFIDNIIMTGGGDEEE